MHAHHETAGVGIAELRRLEDIAPLVREEHTHGADDPRAIGAGEREDVTT
jgi:hypothetical protein